MTWPSDLFVFKCVRSMVQIIDETLGQNLSFYSVIICFKSSTKYLKKKYLSSPSLAMFHNEGIMSGGELLEIRLLDKF